MYDDKEIATSWLAEASLILDRAAKLLSVFFSSTSSGTAWPLHFKFASYLLPMPMTANAKAF